MNYIGRLMRVTGTNFKYECRACGKWFDSIQQVPLAALDYPAGTYFCPTCSEQCGYEENWTPQ